MYLSMEPFYFQAPYFNKMKTPVPIQCIIISEMLKQDKMTNYDYKIHWW